MGEECGLRRPERGSDDGGEADDRVDDVGRPALPDRHGRRDHQRRPDDVGRDHHELAWVPVGEPGEERRGDRGRDHPDHAHDADRGSAALVVGVDRERDEVRPVADQRPGPGELEPAQIRVREDLPERPHRVGDPRPHRGLASSSLAFAGSDIARCRNNITSAGRFQRRPAV